MKLNPRNALICVISIVISGLFASYKSFQLHQAQIRDEQTQQSQLVSQFVGQNLEQKLLQMEAAVSYLDKSTIETLKRFGARYFAYAYKKNNEWAIKWKKLGELGKDEILEEVNALAFDDFSEKKRHWRRAKNNELIYIAPVALAESHQLKEGFLIYGMNRDFFKALKTSDGQYALTDANATKIMGKLPFMMDAETLAAGEQASHIKEIEGGALLIATALFSPISQLWIARSHQINQMGFIESQFFTYFLMTSAFACLLLLLFMMGRENSSETTDKKRPAMSFKLPELSFLKKKQVEHQEPAASIIADQVQEHKAMPATEPTVAQAEAPNEIADEIADFAEYLDSVLKEEIPRLKKVGISIKTQVEEGARLFCRRQHVEDFIKRLVGNSVLTLENEKEKEIQLQLVEQSESFQLIYVDTRSDQFPSKQESTLMAQTEGSLEGIDGIISYARWMFGESLTVAKKGFCVSIDLPKVATVATTVVEPIVEERIEINDADTDMDLIDGFTTLETTAQTTQDEAVDFDNFIEQFRMKEFSFKENEAKEAIDEAVEDQVAAAGSVVEESVVGESVVEESAVEDSAAEVETDERGLFEFNSGQFKIKIRSPKKRDKDVDC